eukprot:142894-Pyramimonas_sp.AAC.1
MGPSGNGHANENGTTLHDLLAHDMGAINTHRKVGPTFIGHSGTTTIDYVFIPSSLIAESTCRRWLATARRTRKNKYFLDHIPIVVRLLLPCPGF